MRRSKKMKKEQYERTEMKVIVFRSEDVIMTSLEDEYETEKVTTVLPLI